MPFRAQSPKKFTRYFNALDEFCRGRGQGMHLLGENRHRLSSQKAGLQYGRPMPVRIVATEEELARCLEIRREVFVEEQKVPEADEIDGEDPMCVHFLATPHVGDPPTEAVGTARLLQRGKTAKAQRVAVVPAMRKKGIGKELMAAIEKEARGRRYAELLLGAQLEAVPFYEKIGYESFGDEYQDAGIPHRHMKKTL